MEKDGNLIMSKNRLKIRLWPSNALKKQSVASSCKLELARFSA